MNFQLFLVKTIIMIQNCRGTFTLTLIDGYKVGHLSLIHWRHKVEDLTRHFCNELMRKLLLFVLLP